MFVPALNSVATPVFPIVATAVFEDVHVTPAEISFAVPSAKRPVAAYCRELWLTLTDVFAGEISIEFKGDVVTLTTVEAVTPSDVADIVAEPEAIAVASPLLLTNTIAAFDVVQSGTPKTFLLPFAYVAWAVNCCWVLVNSKERVGRL